MAFKTQLRKHSLNLLRQVPPDKMLRFLFKIDRWLYFLQGQMAHAYGNGVHPKHRLLNYHDFFVKRVEADEQVLDIGCGIGAVAHAVAERSQAHVTGIDLNPKSIAQAHAQYTHERVRYIVGDVLKALVEAEFDVVIMSNVLEHLPDRSNFLLRVQKTVSPRRFLIRVPLFERDWRVPLKKELGVEWRLDPTHYIEYTLETFSAEMEAAELDITHLEVRWGEIWAELACR